MTQGEWVPKVPTAAMLYALQSDAPYVYRRTADKRAYEVVRMDNANWRECISDQQTVMFVGSEDDAEAELTRLESLYRYEAMLAAAPPPAAARGDVRGLPAGWTVEVDGEHVKVTKPDGAVSEWHKRPATNGSGMYDLCQALAAEGVQAGEDATVTALLNEAVKALMSLNDNAKVLAKKLHSRIPTIASALSQQAGEMEQQAGEMEQQAGEVEQRARELLATGWDRVDPDYAAAIRKNGGAEPFAIRAIASALSQQPEARGVVDVTDEMVERGSLALSNALGGNVVCKALRKDVRAILTAALTGERNG